jgi:Glycosyltransferase
MLEPFAIKKLAAVSKNKVLFVYTQFFGVLVYYRIISKLFGLKTCLSYVELRSSIPSRKRRFQKINDFLFDRYAFAFADAINPISKSLSQRVSQFYPQKPQILIPCICDFSQFGLRKKELASDYFLYCGSAGYNEVVNAVIDAYRMLPRRTVKLLLIISGSPAGLEKITRYVGKDDNIVIESNIEYESLVNLYLNALALLIPLRLTPQDSNRFPHKISEYTASKRPIITTGVGEVTNYFADKENAIIADGVAASQLSKAMNWAVENKEQLDRIGFNGYLTGLQAFSHMAYSEPLDFFLDNI